MPKHPHRHTAGRMVVYHSTDGQLHGLDCVQTYSGEDLVGLASAPAATHKQPVAYNVPFSDDARRLAACWNALADFSTEDIESLGKLNAHLACEPGATTGATPAATGGDGATTGAGAPARIDRAWIIKAAEDVGLVGPRSRVGDSHNALERLADVIVSASAAVPHALYQTHDADAPTQIRDRNGEVVLSMCKVCGKAEAELDGPCAHPAPAVPQGWRFKRNTDGSVGIFAPSPKPGESQRTSHAVYQNQSGDLYELLGKLADHQAATPANAPAQDADRAMLEVIDERDRCHEWADAMLEARK